MIIYIKCIVEVQEFPSPKTGKSIIPSVFMKCVCHNLQLYQHFVHASSCPKHNLQPNTKIFLLLSGTFMAAKLWTDVHRFSLYVYIWRTREKEYGNYIAKYTCKKEVESFRSWSIRSLIVVHVKIDLIYRVIQKDGLNFLTIYLGNWVHLF